MANTSCCDMDVLADAEVHRKSSRAELSAKLETLLSGRHVELRDYLDHWLAQEKAAVVFLLEEQCQSSAELSPTNREAKRSHGGKPSQVNVSNDGFECLGILPEERDVIRPVLGVPVAGKPSQLDVSNDGFECLGILPGERDVIRPVLGMHAAAPDTKGLDILETDSGNQMLTLDERQAINSGIGDHLIMLDVGESQDVGTRNGKHALELLQKRTVRKSATDETIPKEFVGATATDHLPRGTVGDSRETLCAERLLYACVGMKEGSEFPETPRAVYRQKKNDKSPSNVSFHFDADDCSGDDDAGVNAKKPERSGSPNSRSSTRQMTKISQTNDMMPIFSATYTEQDQTRLSLALDKAHEKRSVGREMSMASVVATSIRSRAQKAIRSKYFEPFFAMIIIANSLMFGIQLEYVSRMRDDAIQEPLHFFILQNVFACLFLAEVMLRMLALGGEFFCDSWNYLDLFVVLTSMVELVLDYLNMSTMHEKDEGFESVGSIRIMRMLRVTRLARVIRVIKIVRFLTSLRTLITSIICTLRSLFWAMFLLVMIIYLFAMVFAQLSNQVLEKREGSELLEFYWGSLSISMFTLFKVVSQGISWEECALPLEEVHAFCVALFTCYVIFIHFAVLNVVTGVFCQSAIAAAERDYDLVVQSNLADKTHYTNKLRQLFLDIDDDQNGEIDIKEFERHLMDEKVQAYLTSLELNSSDIWRLFKLLDANESTVIDLEEFLTGCFRLRGPAKAIEMAELMYESRHTRKKLFKFMTNVDWSLRIILEEIGLGSSEAPLESPERQWSFWSHGERDSKGNCINNWRSAEPANNENGVTRQYTIAAGAASRRATQSNHIDDRKRPSESSIGSFELGECARTTNSGYKRTMTLQEADDRSHELTCVKGL